MKKMLSLLICFALIAGSVIAFAACSKQNKGNENTSTSDTESGGGQP